MDKSFVMLIGLPGSGKSTYAAEQFDSKNTTIVSSDKYLEEIAAQKGISYAEAYETHLSDVNAKCTQDVKEAFSAGRNVVWDQTNLSFDERTRKMALVPSDYFKKAVALELSRTEFADRFIARFHETGKSVNPATIEALAKSYERPGRFEGFDYVEILSE